MRRKGKYQKKDTASVIMTRVIGISGFSHTTAHEKTYGLPRKRK